MIGKVNLISVNGRCESSVSGLAPPCCTRCIAMACVLFNVYFAAYVRCNRRLDIVLTGRGW